MTDDPRLHIFPESKKHHDKVCWCMAEKREKLKKLLPECPNCHKNTYVVSIFGSICSNCFYEPTGV